VFSISVILLHFETQAVQRRMVSKMEAKFRTLCPLPVKNYGKGWVRCLIKCSLICTWLAAAESRVQVKYCHRHYDRFLEFVHEMQITVHLAKFATVVQASLLDVHKVRSWPVLFLGLNNNIPTAMFRNSSICAPNDNHQYFVL